jgi:hypothetical protein
VRKQKALAPKREGFSLVLVYPNLVAIDFVNFDQRDAGAVIGAIHYRGVLARLEPNQDGRFPGVRRRVI